jgi:hypothetical protein
VGCRERACGGGDVSATRSICECGAMHDPADVVCPMCGAAQPTCDGMCVDSGDIGVPGYVIVYPHPGCPLHDPAFESSVGETK